MFRKRGGKSKPGFVIGRGLCGGLGFVRIAMIYFHIIVSNDLLETTSASKLTAINVRVAGNVQEAGSEVIVGLR